jgi:hypothetical protein
MRPADLGVSARGRGTATASSSSPMAYHQYLDNITMATSRRAPSRGLDTATSDSPSSSSILAASRRSSSGGVSMAWSFSFCLTYLYMYKLRLSARGNVSASECTFSRNTDVLCPTRTHYTLPSRIGYRLVDTPETSSMRPSALQ